jgi:hypothetical protein
MSRDNVAAMAMQGLLSLAVDSAIPDVAPSRLARVAYLTADAMLTEAAKERP